MCGRDDGDLGVTDHGDARTRYAAEEDGGPGEEIDAGEGDGSAAGGGTGGGRGREEARRDRCPRDTVAVSLGEPEITVRSCRDKGRATSRRDPGRELGDGTPGR